MQPIGCVQTTSLGHHSRSKSGDLHIQAFRRCFYPKQFTIHTHIHKHIHAYIYFSVKHPSIQHIYTHMYGRVNHEGNSQLVWSS